MKFVLSTFFILLCFLSRASANGGVTTIGDGGIVAVCSSHMSRSEPKLFFLDLLEAKIAGRPYVADFEDVTVSLDKKVDTALSRLKLRLQLSEHDLQQVRSVTSVLLRLHFDPTNLYKFSDQHAQIFRVSNIHTSSKVIRFLKKNRCVLMAAVVRFAEPQLSSPDIQYLCEKSPGGTDLCFLTNSSVYFRLPQNERACLILHEALRYLPDHKKPKTEAQLRSWTADICTQ